MVYGIVGGLLWLLIGAGLLQLRRWAAIAAIGLCIISFIAFPSVVQAIILALVLIGWKAFSKATT
jgi:hypothetical protein